MATEKRLIDANAADVEQIFCYYDSNCDINDVQEWLNEQPTVDAVEVVRCKDCKHWWKENETCKHPKCCEAWMCVMQAPKDHFCSYGERKNND